MNRIFCALLLIAICLGACKSKSKTTTKTSSKDAPSTTAINTAEKQIVNTPSKAAPRPEEPYWELQRTGCYGTCPIYKLQIYGNGNAVYEATRFLPGTKLGIYEKQLSRETINELINAFEGAKFWDFKEEYTENVSDLPSTYVTFKNKGKSKKVLNYFNAPAELKNLEDLLDNIIKTKEGWVMVKEAPEQERNPSEN